MSKPNLSAFKLLAPVLVLLVISMIILRSVLPSETVKQLTSGGFSLLVFFLVAKIDYRSFLPLAKTFYALAILLLLLTFVFGEATRGSVRWIQLGPVNLQPSEIVKPLLIFSLAAFAQTLSLRRYSQTLIYFFLTLLPVVLVYLQPDLGSALVILVIGVSIGFVAGIPRWVFLVAAAALLIGSPVLLNFLRPYQRERLSSFLDPLSDPLGSGYSVIQSEIAVGSGKIFGKGLGHGTQSQLRFLPESHSDFIFASLAEELGFVGVALLLTSYAFLLNHLLVLSREAADKLGGLIGVGVFSMIFFQLVVNLGMNLGIMPVTGITLPLVSSGGSSLVTIMAGLGLVESVSKRRKPGQTIEIHADTRYN